MKPISFISFDVEALPSRAVDDHVNRLIWGKMKGGEYGIRRICKILNQHDIKGNFLLDMASCILYGDNIARQIGDFILEQGHDLQVHLHSEWLIRKWKLNGNIHKSLGLDQLDSTLNDNFIKFSAFKFEQLFRNPPTVFRSGGFHFNDHTVEAAKCAGYKMLSNYNHYRHKDIWNISDNAILDEAFRWENGLIELPVDFSPEPLSSDWQVYIDQFDRIIDRKKNKTFNLTMHSWSLLQREGEFFDHFSPLHEERLHAICHHIKSNTMPMIYSDYLKNVTDLQIPSIKECKNLSLFSTSKIVECSICGATFGEEWSNDVCPGCGSRARHRQLHDVFNRCGNPFIGLSVLANFANSVEKTAFLSQASFVLNFDVRPVAEVDEQIDIQDMHQIESESFDAFLAVHVLLCTHPYGSI